MKVKKTRRGIRVDIDRVEATVLRRCVRDLRVLLADGPPAGTVAGGTGGSPGGDAAGWDAPGGAAAVGGREQDALAAMVGMPTGDPVRPVDPALARLLPDAYPDDDPAASAEFRRYTEGELRAGKTAGCAAVLATLPEAGGVLLLDRDAADAWLGCLNDLRLVIGTRLEVTEETDPGDYDEDDPALQSLHVYSWLGWLQESLLGCMDPR